MEEGWKQVYSTVLEYQAEMAKDLLEQAGIKVVVMNQKDSTYLSFGEFLVFVPGNEMEQALEIIKGLAD